MARKSVRALIKERVNNRDLKKSYEWYDLKPILGYSNFAIFLILLGGREAGKSYAVTNFFVDQFVNKGRPFYWLRLSETSRQKLLSSNALKLVDPDLRRRYKLDLMTKGERVYHVTKRGKPDKQHKIGKPLEMKLMATVLDVSTFYNDKGSGYFDKDFLNDPKMYYNICLDEMNREQSERKNFDIVYGLVNQLENLVRSTKDRVRVFMIGNTLEEASDVMCSFNFIPEQFGTYKLVHNKKKLMEYLKKRNELRLKGINPKELDREYRDVNFGKRAVVEYIEPNEAYLNRRKGSIADILLPTASTFTNKIESDYSLIFRGRLHRPTRVIKFNKDTKSWYTLWDDKVIKRYNNEKQPVWAMRRYLDEKYTQEKVNVVLNTFDTRNYQFKDLITFKMFQKELELLKPNR